MATGPASAQQAQLTAVFYGPGVPNGAVCTCGLMSTEGDITAETANSLVGPWGAWHSAAASQDVGLGHIEVKVGPEASGPTYTAEVQLPGSINSPSAGPNVAMLIRKQVSGVSARYSGRMYWPGIPESLTTFGGAIAPSSVTSLQNSADELMNALSGLNLLVVVFSKLEQGGQPLIVNRLVVQGTTATQRLRLRR